MPIDPLLASVFMSSMHLNLYYVYILRSLSNPGCYYTGRTEVPETRINDHNSGKCSHTRKDRPWKIKTLIAFSDKDKAIAFERYLKTRSGRVLTKKRL
jgi:putative endonuclease